MIPKYDLIDDVTGDFVAYANELMTDNEINIATELLQDGDLWAKNSLMSWKVHSLEDVCY